MKIPLGTVNLMVVNWPTKKLLKYPGDDILKESFSRYLLSCGIKEDTTLDLDNSVNINKQDKFIMKFHRDNTNNYKLFDYFGTIIENMKSGGLVLHYASVHDSIFDFIYFIEEENKEINYARYVQAIPTGNIELSDTNELTVEFSTSFVIENKSILDFCRNLKPSYIELLHKEMRSFNDETK